MSKKNDFILKPGTGVDLVLNINSLSPSSRPSILFDVDETKRQVIVAQPAQRIDLITPIKEMYISSLIHKEPLSKARVGYACRLLDIIDRYQPANKDKADAVLLEYSLPLMEINIRSAYRFHPNSSYDVIGKLVYKNEMYYSGQHFMIHNISINGVGLIIPKKISEKRNPLIDITQSSHEKIGIILTNKAENSIETIDSDITVVRTDMEYNEASVFVGCLMTSLPSNCESVLNKFIHNALLHIIQKFNRLR